MDRRLFLGDVIKQSLTDILATVLPISGHSKDEPEKEEGGGPYQFLTQPYLQVFSLWRMALANLGVHPPEADHRYPIVIGGGPGDDSRTLIKINAGPEMLKDGSGAGSYVIRGS